MKPRGRVVDEWRALLSPVCESLCGRWSKVLGVQPPNSNAEALTNEQDAGGVGSVV
jgi:hypothetical protein